MDYVNLFFLCTWTRGSRVKPIEKKVSQKNWKSCFFYFYFLQFNIWHSRRNSFTLSRGEEGQPQQYLVRATSKPSSLQYYFQVSNPPRWYYSGHVWTRDEILNFWKWKNSLNWIIKFINSVLQNVSLFTRTLINNAKNYSGFIKL